MEWILGAPEYFRKSFIQGICDGDGSAHNFRRVEISCEPNQRFIIDLLRTFYIKSRIDDDSVNIINNYSLKKAAKIPIFRHAKGRKEKLYKILSEGLFTEMLPIYLQNTIIKMVSNPQKSGKGANIEIQKRIISLRKKGYSAGIISEKIFDEFGIGIYPSSIYQTYKRYLLNLK